MSNNQLEKILLLPKKDKVKIYEALASDLYGNTEDEFELTEDDRKELRRRLAEIKSGKAKLIPWEEIRKKHAIK